MVTSYIAFCPIPKPILIPRSANIATDRLHANRSANYGVSFGQLLSRPAGRSKSSARFRPRTIFRAIFSCSGRCALRRRPRRATRTLPVQKPLPDGRSRKLLAPSVLLIPPLRPLRAWPWLAAAWARPQPSFGERIGAGWRPASCVAGGAPANLPRTRAVARPAPLPTAPLRP